MGGRIAARIAAAWLLLALSFTATTLQGCEADTSDDPPGGNVLQGAAFLVETIPYEADLELIHGGRHTWEVLTSFVDQAQSRIHFSAVYWNLLEDSNITADTRGRWGTDKGELLLSSLRNAAKRGVHLFAICGIGISGVDELKAIQDEFPDKVSYQIYDAHAWYGGGIMHMKAWIFDDTRALVTSSNTDWKSLTQVKEMGVAVEGPPGFQFVKDLQLYFDRWWTWTDPALRKSLAKPQMKVYDPVIDQYRMVPCFSIVAGSDHVPECPNPFPDSSHTRYNLANRMPLVLNGTAGGTILTCSPPGICDTPTSVYSKYGPAPAGRTWDGDALVQTIQSATSTVSLSVMDYIPTTMYDMCAGAWWPALNDALLAKLAQGTHVRLLISRWQHTKSTMATFLHALDSMAKAVLATSKHNGTFEIRLFELAGWQNTSGLDGQYPTFSRVNHAKYIVTDQLFNVGTSNMEWSYFYNTAGTSFNSDHPLLRGQLQSVFDRDWASAYAKRFVPELLIGRPFLPELPPQTELPVSFPSAGELVAETLV